MPCCTMFALPPVSLPSFIDLHAMRAEASLCQPCPPAAMPAGDAFFDLDAAQFLLEELQQQRRQQGPQQLQSLEDQPAGQQAGVQQDGALAGATQRQPGREQHQQSAQQQPGAKAEGAAGPGGVLGHAVGPRWVQQLPAGGAALSGSAGSVQLEYGCEVASVQLRYSQPGAEEQQAQRAGEASQGPSPDRTQASSSPHAEPSLLLTLTNGKQLEVDLVLLAIGVAPALEWVPASLQHSADGGLRVNRWASERQACMVLQIANYEPSCSSYRTFAKFAEVVFLLPRLPSACTLQLFWGRWFRLAGMLPVWTLESEEPTARA